MTARLAAALIGAALVSGSLASCRANQEPGSEAAAKRAVRDYIAALDARSGRRVCDEMAPGALADLALPKREGSCASSIAASIGYRDPRGYPVWRRTRILRFRSLDVQDTTARATVTVKTTFADGREPSIEDDVVYLTRGGASWTIAKPSATLYRAIGSSTPPLSALRAP